MDHARCQAHDHHRWSSVRHGIAEDIKRYLSRSEDEAARGQGLVRRLSAWLTPELMCLTLYRVGHFLYVRDWPMLARILAGVNFFIHKVRLPAASCIGPGCRLSHPAGVVFEGSAGGGLTLYSYVLCLAGEREGDGFASAPVLGDGVTLGGHAVLSGNVRVGDDVQIAPTAVVREDVPAGVIVASRAMMTATHLSTDSHSCADAPPRC